jgi:phosphatidylethanolamine/phosphatidyl-N-methylethanolamine N-methyltransferase
MSYARNSAKNYYEQYSSGFMRKGWTGKIFKHANKMIEREFHSDSFFDKVLELGATDFNHLNFVRHNFSKYVVSDLNTQVLENLPPPSRPGISIKKLDASNLSQYPNEYFDRIIVTCLILHLNNVEGALTEWRRILKPGGYISIYVHCEPGMLLRLSRFLVNQRKSKAKGFDHIAFVYSEHISYFLAVKYAIKHIFSNDKISSSSFPFKYFSWNFNLWKIFTIQKQKNS